MKYDKKMTMITESKISDGMGGWLPSQPIDMGTLDVFMTPIKADILLKEHGIISTTALKVFTKDEMPQSFKEAQKELFKLKYNDTNYKIIQYANFGKIRMMMVEVIF